MLMYFQGYLMDTDLMERTLPLPFSLTGAGKLKLMSIQILLEGQKKSSCLSAEGLLNNDT